MRICRWDEAGLAVSDLILLMTAAGNELPVPLTARVDVPAYTKKLLANGFIYVVLSDDGTPAGIMGFYANDQDTKAAYLSILSLLPEARRRGFGGKLMKRLISDAENAGMHTVRLKVDQGNRNAVAFYERAGFVVEDVVEDKNIMIFDMT